MKFNTDDERSNTKLFDLTEFKHSATRTESLIDSVKLNPKLFNNLLTAYIQIGNSLDQIKKNVFYNKTIDKETMKSNVLDAIIALNGISNTSLNPENIEHIDINPRIFHGTIGVATESVELMETLERAMSGQDVDWINLGEEIFDCNWYEQILLDELGLDWKTVMDTGIHKLKTRYPEKFTQDNAINRDLNGERQVLEDGLSK